MWHSQGLYGGARGFSVVWAIAAISTSAALAAPPPADSEDYKIMAPFRDWITRQHDQADRWCCDIGDGRPVDAKLVTVLDADGVERTHWSAHITPAHWPDETDRWVVVPDEKVVKGINPTGSAILWLYQARPQCFAPPAGV